MSVSISKKSKVSKHKNSFTYTASEKECFCNLTSTFECKKIITTSYRKKYPTKWSNDIDVFLVIVKFKRIEKNAENENVTF